MDIKYPKLVAKAKHISIRTIIKRLNDL